MGTKFDGSYFYDRVLPLIDYSGDIRRGNGIYSASFSPNNIKRLIISPECVACYYHVPVNGRSSSSVMLNPQLIARCVSLDDYKPVMSVLYADRVCASIEEIVILNKPSIFSNLDMDFKGMIKGYNKVTSDLVEVVKQRYKRFRAFVVANMTYNEFMAGVKAHGKVDLVADLDFMQGAHVFRFNTDVDWYKAYGSSAQFYEMDRVGGVLNNHFKTLIEKKEKEAKDGAIAKVKAERVGGLTEEWEKEYNLYKGACKAYNMIYNMLSTQPSCLFRGILVPCIPKSFDKPDTKEGLQESLKELKTSFISTYVSLYSIYDQALSKKVLGQYTYEAVLSTMDTSLRVPPQFGSGGTAGRVDSFAILCANLVIGFVRKTDGKDVGKYCEKSTWMEVLK